MKAELKNVTNCTDCPFLRVDYAGWGWCEEEGKGTWLEKGNGRSFIVPEWCPLKQSDFIFKLNEKPLENEFPDEIIKLVEYCQTNGFDNEYLKLSLNDKYKIIKKQP